MRARGRRREPRARYRVRDWASYDRALARRGDITVWLSPEVVAGWRAPAGRRTFSDTAIAAALAVRAVYRLALRQVEGLMASIFALLGMVLPVPDHTTLSRRGRALRLDRCADAGGGLDLAIDSTGLRLARPPGAGGEGWRKLVWGVGAQFRWGTWSGSRGRRQVMRIDTGMPSLVMRLSTAQPTRASVFWAAGVRARRPGPIRALYLNIAVSPSERRP